MARPSDPELDALDPDDGDDDALSWAGDDLRGGIDPLTRNRVSAIVDPTTPAETSAIAAQPSNLLRAAVTVLFALLFLAVVVGWILSVQLTSPPSTDLFTEIAWQFGEFVALISGALWFLAVLTLTADSRTRVRLGWFALGVGVLAPWPILLAAL